MGIKEIAYAGVKWIQQTQNRDQMRAPGNMVINLGGPQKVGIY
jgi:hypothetical protein